MVDMGILASMNTFQLGALILVLCSIIKRSDGVSKISIQSLITLIILLITYATPLYAQPLSQPAESFKCGPSNLTCDRWGFVACLSPDEDYYCAPCDVEYLEDLCGTKDEVQGCNLYCTKLAVDRASERMRAEFNDTIAVLHKNFTKNITNTNTEFAIKNSVNLETQSYLQKQLSTCENERLVLVCLSVLFVIVVSFGIYCLICRKRGLDDANCKQEEEQEPLSSCSSEDTVAEKEVKISISPDVSDNEVQTDNEEVTQAVCNQDREQATGDNCPGYKKLQSINPTNEAGDDKTKLAIDRNDHEYTQKV